MTYTINKTDEGYIVTVAEYPNLKHTIVNSIFNENEIDAIVEQSIEHIVQDYLNQNLEYIRLQRNQEFSIYDKYQLMLVWQSLTAQQQNEYAAWRNAWLDATTTLVTPSRLIWFD